MKKTSDVVAMVIDTSGNYLSLAVRLTKEYKTVYYCIPWWIESYPKPNKTKIGEGIEGVEVVNNPWDVYDEIDFWIFPDVYTGSFQEFLKSQGEITWGSGNAEELELYRDVCKEQMAELGLPVNPWKKIVGFDALENHLKKNDNLWLKVNFWRGLFETRFHKNYELSKEELLVDRYNLAAIEDSIEFIVEDPIEDENGQPVLEQGYDGFTMRGTCPELWLSGCEVKDKAYAGQIKKYSDLSPLITQFNTAFAKKFKDYKYTGFLSLENRIVGKKSIMTDFTGRMPCPPGSIYLLIFKNLGEVMWAAANGEMVKPEAVKQFGVELLIESQWACNHAMTIYYPPKIADQIFLKKYKVKDGLCTIVPQQGGTSDVGSVAGIGDTLEAAIKSCQDSAALIEGTEISIHAHCLDAAQECLDMANKL
jgi:hypothetical protein